MPYNTFADIVKVPYSTRPNFEDYTGPLIKRPPMQGHLKEKQALRASELEKGGKLSWFGDNYFSMPRAGLLNRMNEKLNAISLTGYTISIEDIGLAIQEDIALMANGKLVAAHIMFPSGWAPEEKAGMSFAMLHSPVPDNVPLITGAESLVKIMCTKTIHRYVWGLSYNDNLSHHPKYDSEVVNYPDHLGAMQFRWEHQISVPLTDNASIFLIDVRQKPFETMSSFDRARITTSVNSMTDEMLAYKKLWRIKEVLNATAARDYSQEGHGGSRFHYGIKPTSFATPNITS